MSKYRMTVELDREMHHDVLEATANSNITITRFVKEAIARKLRDIPNRANTRQIMQRRSRGWSLRAIQK